MQTLTAEGQKKLAEIAARHGVSSDAAAHLLAAIAAGGGSQAQFDHPELGGMGQWSQGGMIMIGDMFNQALKARVAALCSDLAAAWQDLPASAPEDKSGRGALPAGTPGGRWPAELGRPASSGSQNDMHYAVFPDSRRLAIERRGTVTVYDTGDHRIGGVSQQQSGDQSLRFTSQLGPVRLADLPIVRDRAEAEDTAPADDNSPAPAPAPRAGNHSDDDIFSRLERLADLRSRDIISAEEFATKKAELLARL